MKDGKYGKCDSCGAEYFIIEGDYYFPRSAECIGCNNGKVQITKTINITHDLQENNVEVGKEIIAYRHQFRRGNSQCWQTDELPWDEFKEPGDKLIHTAPLYFK